MLTRTSASRPTRPALILSPNLSLCSSLPLLLALSLAACAVDTDLDAKADPYTPPEFATASEFKALQSEDPQLCMQGASAIEFKKAGQSFGFVIAAPAGAKVTIATTGNPDLDTVVALYGPADAKGYFGKVPVAADDDAGPGSQSLINAYEVKTSGSYYILVSTYGGEGVGTATLEVKIDGEAGCTDGCVANDECAKGEACVDGACVVQSTCTPVAEVCGDGVDNDCDEEIDEECEKPQCVTADDCKGIDPDVACDGEWSCAAGECLWTCVGIGCVTDADCGEGYVCENATCVVVACADGAVEVCGDSLDNDCDGEVDEGCGAMTCSVDADCVGFTVDTNCEGAWACENGWCNWNCEDTACTVDTDCAEGYVCANATCVVATIPCSSNADCDTDLVCQDGFCVIPDLCAQKVCDDGDPATIDTCDTTSGVCVYTPATCTSDADCDAGYVCVAGVCAVEGCSDPTAEVCDGIDNDCDGEVDEGFDDLDQDGLDDCADLDDDNDGILDTQDNCPSVPNADQRDFDNNGIGDACDGGDLDEDGIPDEADNCPAAYNPDQKDTDQDGVGDACDMDTDNDGTPNASDCAPLDASIHPLAFDVCDGLDNDCDGVVDDGADASCAAGYTCTNGVCVAS